MGGNELAQVKRGVNRLQNLRQLLLVVLKALRDDMRWRNKSDDKVMAQQQQVMRKHT